MNREKYMFLVPVLMPCLLGLWLCSDTAQAQERKTIWSGIYTEAEATRGQEIYGEFCVNCHSTTLRGQPDMGGPPLAGEKFMENWREDTVENLFLKIRNTMPRQGFGGSQKVLTDAETFDLLAYIFKENSFPTGSELSPAAIKDVSIELQDGPKPLPNYSQIEIVGCMNQEAGNWVLANAALPTRLRGAGETIEPETVKAAETKALGSRKFPLQNLLMLGDFNAAAHKGHRMVARGVLIRQGGTDRISVTGLEMVSANCSQ